MTNKQDGKAAIVAGSSGGTGEATSGVSANEIRPTEQAYQLP